MPLPGSLRSTLALGHCIDGEGSLLTLARALLEEGWGASPTRVTPRAGGRQGFGGGACLQLF